MMEILKKYKLVFIGIVSLFVVLVILLSVRVQSISTDLRITNVSELDLSVINVGDATLLGAFTTEADIVQVKPHKVLKFAGGNFNIYGFSATEGGDNLGGGGCHMIRFDNYIEVDGNYYKATLENLAKVIQPDSKGDFVKLVNLNSVLNPLFCGMQVFLYEGIKTYNPNLDVSCKVPYVNIESTFNKEAEKNIFTYFIEDMQGFSLSKATLVFQSNSLTATAEPVFICEAARVIY